MKIYNGFKCEFCNKILKQEKSMERHEIYCRSNPTNFVRCLNCENMVKSVIINEYKTIFCNLHKKYLFEKKAANNVKLANIVLEFAPATCEYFIEKLQEWEPLFDDEKWNESHKKDGIEKIF